MLYARAREQCAITIDQLAVENGRAVFIVHDDELGNSLWLINLRGFADHADFVAAPPKPVSLCAFVLRFSACFVPTAR